MSKRILILLLFLSIIPVINAQDKFKPTTHIGIHGGVNFCRAILKPVLNQGLVTSEAYGIVFRHVSEPNIGIQFEVNVSEKGWKEIIDSVGTYVRKIESFDFPLMATFIVGQRTIRFAFTIGPYLSYLRDEKETINIPDPLKYRDHYQKPLTLNWQFGFTGGVAAEIHTKIGAFAVRASYNHAVSNLFPLKDTYYFSGSRTQVLHAGVMYMFSF